MFLLIQIKAGAKGVSNYFCSSFRNWLSDLATLREAGGRVAGMERIGGG